MGSKLKRHDDGRCLARAALPALFLFLLGCAGTLQSGGRTDSGPRPGPVPAALPKPGSSAGTANSQVVTEPGAISTGSATAQQSAVSPVVARATLSRSAADRTGPWRLVLKVDYTATANVTLNRPPLNIALVLDRSGSMAEDRKLPYTQEAARWVVENMTERDVLSIVAFNERVTILSAAGRVVNKPFLFHRLEEISPDGYTDLSAGLLEGIAQVESQRAEGQVQQVLLLTDGLANRGVTDSMALKNISAKAAAKGIGVSTFGTGTEFNERLLADMAAAGAGRYTYIKSPEQIPMAFKDELRGLLQVVAQNAVVEVIVNNGQIIKVYGQVLEQPVRSYRFPIGNLRAAEGGFLLMELDAGLGVEGEIRLTFDDPQAGGRVTQHIPLATSKESDKLKENEDVLLYRDIIAALEQAEVAAQGLDVQRYRDARAAFDRLYDRVRERAMQSRDQELLNQAFVLKHFMEELAASEQTGLLHGHNEAREKLKKESHYLRYLLTHHRPPRP